VVVSFFFFLFFGFLYCTWVSSALPAANDGESVTQTVQTLPGVGANGRRNVHTIVAARSKNGEAVDQTEKEEEGKASFAQAGHRDTRRKTRENGKEKKKISKTTKKERRSFSGSFPETAPFLSGILVWFATRRDE
jgi:hypothetical protein